MKQHPNWEYELHYDSTLDAGNCPNCGGSGVFNCHVSHGAQYVGSPRKGIEEQQGNMHQDDVYQMELTRVMCGHCEAVLLSEDEDEVLDEGEDIHCPGCGDILFHNLLPRDIGTPRSTKACPNKCGWIQVKQNGEKMTIERSPATY